MRRSVLLYELRQNFMNGAKVAGTKGAAERLRSYHSTGIHCDMKF